MEPYSEVKQLYSRTIVNGRITEDIRLVSQSKNGEMEMKGSVNGKPVHVYSTQKRRPAIASSLAFAISPTKKVRFANDTEMVSNVLDRMPTPFAPTIMYKTGNKSRRRRQKKHRRRRSKTHKRRSGK